LEHVVPAAHVFPHVPQFVLLERRFTHDPEQYVAPVPQTDLQRLLMQAFPVEQTLPHVPQLLESLRV
jgi:hypothetical protein